MISGLRAAAALKDAALTASGRGAEPAGPQHEGAAGGARSAEGRWDRETVGMTRRWPDGRMTRDIAENRRRHDETEPDAPAPAAPAAPAPRRRRGGPRGGALRTRPGRRRRGRRPRRFPTSPARRPRVASAGGAAAQGRGRAGQRPPRPATRDPDDTSPLLTRRAWMGLAWGAFSAASAAALAATGRFMFPNVLNEPPQQFKAGFPNEYGMGVDERWKEKFGVWIVRTPDDIVAQRERVLRAARHLHAPGLHAELPVGGSQVQVPVPRQRLPHDRHQLRRAGAASARARAHRARRRRPDPGRQGAQVPVRAGAVDRSGSVSARR